MQLINSNPKKQFDIYKPIMMWNNIRFIFEPEQPLIINLKTINKIFGFDVFVS